MRLSIAAAPSSRAPGSTLARGLQQVHDRSCQCLLHGEWKGAALPNPIKGRLLVRKERSTSTGIVAGRQSGIGSLEWVELKAHLAADIRFQALCPESNVCLGFRVSWAELRSGTSEVAAASCPAGVLGCAACPFTARCPGGCALVGAALLRSCCAACSGSGPGFGSVSSGAAVAGLAAMCLPEVTLKAFSTASARLKLYLPLLQCRHIIE